MMEQFAAAYGYDVNKHQPHHNNGEIDLEYLQAYVAECRAKEEKAAKEAHIKRQKDEFKAKMLGTSG